MIYTPIPLPPFHAWGKSPQPKAERRNPGP
nr:MAG TPA: hypothetical protein [Caudoviricetes sp.]